MRYFLDPPPEMEENFVFPCGVCGKRVGKRMRAIKCDLCNYWNHIKCDGVEPTHYEILKKVMIPLIIIVNYARKKSFHSNQSIMKIT